MDVVAINAAIVGLRARQFRSHLMRERPKTIQRLYKEFEKYCRSDNNFRMCMEEQSQPGFAVSVQTGWYTADSGATGGRRYRFAPCVSVGVQIFWIWIWKLKSETKISKNTSRFI
jgi:hypothetical protein